MLLSYIQTAFILTPMASLSFSFQGHEQKCYYGSLFKIQGILAILFVVLIFLSTGIWQLAFKEEGLNSIFMAMGLCIAGVQMQEFVRRFFFNNFKGKNAILNDIVCYGGQIVGFIFLIWNAKVSAVSTFLVIAASSTAASLLGLYQCLPYFDLRKHEIISTFKRQWGYGKWLLASLATQWVSGQIYIYISAFLINISAAGVIGACQNIYGVINVALTGIRNFLLPYGAKKYAEQGVPFLRHFFKKIYLVGSFCLLSYALLTSFFSSEILQLLYKGKYGGFEYIVILFAIKSVVSFYSFSPDMGLLIIQKTEGIFKSNLVALTMTLLIAFPLIYFLGIAGALIGMIISQSLITIILTKIYRAEINKMGIVK